jgi:hypothetical protein
VAGRWSWLALGVGAYLAFTLATFPASTAYEWFAPPEITLGGVEGTLWSGSAASGAVAGLPMQNLRWRVRPWSLLLGRVAASVEARLADGFISTSITASPSSVRFTDLSGGTSLPYLANVLPVRGMRGQASVTLSTLEIAGGWPSRVNGELRLAGLEVAPFVPNGTRQLLALGDYTVTFVDAPERGVAASFVDKGGPLEVKGTLTLDAARAYTLDALIEPRAGAPEQLVEGLKIMTAEPDAEGRRRLTLTGSL